MYPITRARATEPTAGLRRDRVEVGVPAALNGVEMSLVDLVRSLETIAGAHGVGRVDVIENRLPGAKSREIYQAPAAVVLHAAHASCRPS